MLYAYRVLIIPEVAGLISNILVVQHLIDRAIAINNIMSAHLLTRILKNVQRIQRSALNIVNHHLQHIILPGPPGALIGAGSSRRNLIAIKFLGIEDTINRTRIIHLAIVNATVWKRRRSSYVRSHHHMRLYLLGN